MDSVVLGWNQPGKVLVMFGKVDEGVVHEFQEAVELL